MSWFSRHWSWNPTSEIVVSFEMPHEYWCPTPHVYWGARVLLCQILKLLLPIYQREKLFKNIFSLIHTGTVLFWELIHYHQWDVWYIWWSLHHPCSCKTVCVRWYFRMKHSTEFESCKIQQDGGMNDSKKQLRNSFQNHIAKHQGPKQFTCF